MRTLYSVSALALALSLSACGGSGSSVNSPGTTPPPVNPQPKPDPEPEPQPEPKPEPEPEPEPEPQPEPKPDPIPVEKLNAESALSAAVKGSKANFAYAKGITGKGVTLAIIDTGIDVDGAEFAGRISADSKSFETTFRKCDTCALETTNFGLDDKDGHGTSVAAVAAGARDGEGMHGVAYESTILALKVRQPNLQGVTADTPSSSIQESASPDITKVAPAINYAVDKGAFVISMSISGWASGQYAIDQRRAMDRVRQNDLLLVQAVDNAANADAFTGRMAENLVGSDFTNKDWFLFGIRVKSDLSPPRSNGVPGALADRTLAVVADNIDTVDENGNVIKQTGNSFAAPAIAGAAALLKQNWPQLGGKDISRILLDTATDLGAPGVDQIYGAGLMNIEAAMQPINPQLGLSSGQMSSIAGTNLTFSGAFGGAAAAEKFSAGAGESVVLDAYGRDYKMNVGGLSNGAAPRGISLSSLAYSEPEIEAPAAENQVSALRVVSAPDGRVKRRPAGQFGFRFSPKLAVAGSINSNIESNGLMSGSMMMNSGLATQGSAFNLFLDGLSVKFGVASEDSQFGSRQRVRGSTQQVVVTTKDGFSFGIATSSETGSALGMRGAGAFNIEGAKTRLASVGWSGDVSGWRLSADAMLGHTKVLTNGDMFRFNDAVMSSGFRLQASTMAFGGLVNLGVTSPLKVERASLNYMAPAAYDYETGAIMTEARNINLAPSAREMNLEMGWSAALPIGSLSLGAAYGFNSGNVAGQNAAAGWLKFNRSF